MEIVIWPDDRLRLKSKPVLHFDDELKQFARELTEAMYHFDGAGIAAIQVGSPKRVFVIDIPPESNDGEGTDGPLVLINPEIVETRGSVVAEEGCISIPGIYGKVRRASFAKVSFQDLVGQKHTIEGSGYLAQALLHEYDHLEGKLWIDYQSKLKQNLIRKKMLKLKEQDRL